MRRLEEARQRLSDLLAEQEQDRARLVELADREQALEGDEASEWRDRTQAFDGRAEQITAVEGEIRQLERIAAAPEQARQRPVATTATATRDEALLEDGAEHRGPREVVDIARRALEAGHEDGGFLELEDRHREAALRTLRGVHGDRAAVARHLIATGRSAYRSAFAKLMDAALRGQVGAVALTENEHRAVEAVRAASLTDASGGYAIPFTLDPSVILTGDHDGFMNSWRQVSRVVQITSDKWNGVSSAGVTASWDGEAAQVGDDTPTLAQPSIDVYKAQAFVPFSVEIQGDWAGMETEFRMMFAVAKDDLEEAAFASASAPSNSPTGLIYTLDGTSSELSPTTAETFVLADVHETYDTLPRRHRMRGVWMAEATTYGKIRQLDNAAGGGLWSRLEGDRPEALLGHGVYESPSMRGYADVNAAATADNFILVYGDFSRYIIVDRVGMSVELVPHLFGTANNRPTGQRGLYAWWRVGAKCVDTNAFTVMNVATTA